MTQQDVRSRARCESCGKAYRVPSPDRTYACKACGGTVQVLTGSELASTGGLNGTAPGTADERRPPSATRREQAADLRHEANAALKSAYTWIGAVGWLYRLGALAYAVATAFAVMALARTDVPEAPGVLVVCLTTLLSVLMLMGALQILFQPVAWTLAIALLATVVSIVHLVGPNPFGVAFLASAVWAVVAWAALLPTRRFRSLVSQHEELYIMHHASAVTRRSLKDRTPEERHERLLGAMHRAARRAWRTSTAAAALLALLSAFGTYAVLTSLRPGLLTDSVESFESAWNDSDLARVVAQLPPSLQEQQAAHLAGVTAGHWGERLPALPEGQMQREENRASIEYAIDDVTVRATWYLGGQQWALIGLDLPVPPLEPSIDAFVEAWKRGDAEAIAGMFAEDARASMRESIQTAASERGWDSFPELGERKVGNPSSGSTEAVFELERGELETLWHLRADGTWGMHGLKLPRRRRSR